jgi:hypothetical protein
VADGPHFYDNYFVLANVVHTYLSLAQSIVGTAYDEEEADEEADEQAPIG